MFSKLFLIIATILYYVYANPVSEPSKKSLDYTKMSCLVRQITHPQEFEEQQLINPLPAAMNLIYLFISLIQNWNKECWKKNKKIVYIKVEQNICYSLADTMKKHLGVL